jgi:hypothetical protein
LPTRSSTAASTASSAAAEQRPDRNGGWSPQLRTSSSSGGTPPRPWRPERPPLALPPADHRRQSLSPRDRNPPPPSRRVAWPFATASMRSSTQPARSAVTSLFTIIEAIARGRAPAVGARPHPMDPSVSPSRTMTEAATPPAGAHSRSPSTARASTSAASSSRSEDTRLDAARSRLVSRPCWARCTTLARSRTPVHAHSGTRRFGTRRASKGEPAREQGSGMCSGRSPNSWDGTTLGRSR